MTGQVISLISSSPEPRSAKPRRHAPSNPRKRSSDSALTDLTDGIANARSQPEKRTRRESPPIRVGSILDTFDLSDFSDPLDLPEPAAKSKPIPVAKDPARVFARARHETIQSPGKKAAGSFSTRYISAFDDPIELSSTPDPVPKRRADPHANAVNHSNHLESDPFSFSPSPERRPCPNQQGGGRGGDAGSRQRGRTTPPRDAHKPSYTLDSPSPTTSLSLHRPPKDWDPISSSAPEPQNTKVINLDSDSGPPDLLLSDDSFPDLQDLHAAPKPYRSPLTRRNTATGPLHPRAKTNLKRAASYTPASTAAPKKTAGERAREKELRTAARESEKARKKAERDEARAVKAREKERAAALAEVNKVRTDKRVAAGEMIVDMPASLDEAVALQVRTLLSDLGVEAAEWESPLPRVIRWRRKVRSEFNEALGYYEPVPQRIEKEDLALVIMGAEEFVDACLGVEGRDLERHVRMLRRHFPGYGVLYLIEGLEPWMRRNKNVRNRQFAAAVRGTDAPSSRQGNSRGYVDEEVVEDALLGLQVRHGARIHHTAAGIETARWITTFTQHLSTAPYRRRRDQANASAAAFCMDAGQVRSGEDARDAYMRLLQEVNRVTAPVAYGVAAEFGSVGELVRGLEARGPLGVAECRKGINREGELGERTIGQALSRRLYKVFTGKDEASMDV